jgi:hypothetical protein
MIVPIFFELNIRLNFLLQLEALEPDVEHEYREWTSRLLLGYELSLHGLTLLIRT